MQSPSSGRMGEKRGDFELETYACVCVLYGVGYIVVL